MHGYENSGCYWFSSIQRRLREAGNLNHYLRWKGLVADSPGTSNGARPAPAANWLNCDSAAPTLSAAAATSHCRHFPPTTNGRRVRDSTQGTSDSEHPFFMETSWLLAGECYQSVILENCVAIHNLSHIQKIETPAAVFAVHKFRSTSQVNCPNMAKFLTASVFQGIFAHYFSQRETGIATDYLQCIVWNLLLGFYFFSSWCLMAKKGMVSPEPKNRMK